MLRTIWQFNPVQATIFGIHEYDYTLGDVSADSFLGHAKTFGRLIGALQSEVDPSLLDAEQRLDYYVASSLASANFIFLEHQRPWVNNPSIYPFAAVWGCFGLLTHEFAPFEERLRSMLSRMREIPDMLAVSRDNISSPASVFAQVAVEIVRGGLSFFRNVVPGIASRTPSLEPELLAASEAVISAFEDYETWLRETVLPHARGTFAAGHDTYEQLLRTEHYLSYTPAHLVRLATGVVRKAQEEIREVAASIAPSLTWQELVADLKRDHPPNDGLLDAYRRAVESTRQFVVDRGLVTIPEGERLDVVETPEFERSTMPYAACFPPPPFETSNTGFLWVTPVDAHAPRAHQEAQLLGHCVHSIPIIALHEGYPGHHLQRTWALSCPSALRKLAMNNLLTEGWALYCEHLMYEEGFYADPRVRLFQLKDVLWRACRVTIDVGLHTAGMTFDEAVQMLVQEAHLEEINAVAEVKRYAMSPTQPMTYVIGMLLILDLRDRMKRKMGSDFDLRQFHDRLLSYGSIPPALIAERLLEQPTCEMSPVPQRRSA